MDEDEGEHGGEDQGVGSQHACDGWSVCAVRGSGADGAQLRRREVRMLVTYSIFRTSPIPPALVLALGHAPS